jgi:hypothetical protein
MQLKELKIGMKVYHAPVYDGQYRLGQGIIIKKLSNINRLDNINVNHDYAHHSLNGKWLVELDQEGVCGQQVEVYGVNLRPSVDISLKQIVSDANINIEYVECTHAFAIEKITRLVNNVFLNSDVFQNWLYGDDGDVIKALIRDTYLVPVLEMLKTDADGVINKYLRLEKPYTEAEHLALVVKRELQEPDVIDYYLQQVVKSNHSMIDGDVMWSIYKYVTHNIEYYEGTKNCSFYVEFKKMLDSMGF